MNPMVVVFSPDTIRGNITTRKLQREGFEVLYCDRLPNAVEAVATRAPRVFIFDTTGCITDELRLLARVYDTLRGGDTICIGLGDPAMELTWLKNQDERLVLPDPLDPERITALTREAFSAPKRPPRETGETGNLEADLMDFLRLR